MAKKKHSIGIIPPIPNELAHNPLIIPTVGETCIVLSIISVLSFKYLNLISLIVILIGISLKIV